MLRRRIRRRAENLSKPPSMKRANMSYLRLAEIRMREALKDLSQMATETTDPDPAYQRAYADIAKYVRERALAALNES